MLDILSCLEELEARRLHVYTDADAGLRAFLVIDDLTLGPAAGGIRTAAYPSPVAAIRDAARLARAMTLKCAVAGLDSGGAKMVVMDRPELDRARAFATLGRRVDELDGLFVTAGDLGTTAADLRAMARHTAHVSLEESSLAAAVARGVAGCIAACTRLRERSLKGLRVAIQGCGAMGSAVARELAEASCEVRLTDVREAAARGLARELGATAIGPEDWLGTDVDVLVPCATGDVIDRRALSRVRAWAICGAANNVLAEPDLDAELLAREILFVPDFIASAGAVIAGICKLRGRDPDPLIEGLGATAEDVLRRARTASRSPTSVATAVARERIAAAR